MEFENYQKYFIMKKFFKITGVIFLLLIVYVMFQYLFTTLAVAAYMVYAIVTGIIPLETFSPENFSPEMFADTAALMKDPAMSGIIINSMAIGLFLSAAAMLLFIHAIKLFRIRKSLFTSIAPKPLLWSTLLVFSSIFALNTFVQWFPLENILENEFDGLSRNIIGAFTIAVLAPVLEEVMFRGAIQGYMMRRVRSPWLAIIVASLVFGIFHMNPVQIVYASLLGIILGWIYYRTGSLMSVIVGHVLNNTIATITELLIGNEEDVELLSDMSQGATIAAEAGIFAFFALLSVLFAYKLHKSLPAVPVPWHESDEPATESAGAGCADIESSAVECVVQANESAEPVSETPVEPSKE